ncbi:MAG: adenylate kinase [Burkholderiales bacterium]
MANVNNLALRERAAESEVKRVAVFGNAGGGKSTLARRLAELTRLPLYVVDMMQFRVGGVAVPHDEFLTAHAALLQRDAWIIDGYGTVKLAWERFSAADTLVYVDLPFFVHFLWITKRLLKGLFIAPEGWPEGSPVISSTLSSYRVLWLCHRHLTPKYRALVAAVKTQKRVHHLRSAREMSEFLDDLRLEHRSSASR